MQKRVACIVHGDVQGVAYRDFTRSAAKELGLVGFVRNLPDDTVEAVAEGEEMKLREFLQALKEKHPFARVERIDEAWGEPAGEFEDFQVVRW